MEHIVKSQLEKGQPTAKCAYHIKYIINISCISDIWPEPDTDNPAYVLVRLLCVCTGICFWDNEAN